MQAKNCRRAAGRLHNESAARCALTHQHSYQRCTWSAFFWGTRPRIIITIMCRMAGAWPHAGGGGGGCKCPPPPPPPPRALCGLCACSYLPLIIMRRVLFVCAGFCHVMGSSAVANPDWNCTLLGGMYSCQRACHPNVPKTGSGKYRSKWMETSTPDCPRPG